MHNIVEETIINEINYKYFIIKCGETKDKFHVKLIYIVIRKIFIILLI